MFSSAGNPDSANSFARNCPPVSTTEHSASSLNATAVRRELVNAVRLGMFFKYCAMACTVVPTPKKILSPGSTNRAAAAAMTFFFVRVVFGAAVILRLTAQRSLQDRTAIDSLQTALILQVFQIPADRLNGDAEALYKFCIFYGSLLVD